MRKSIVVSTRDNEEACVTVEEFDGHVQILISHDFATAAVAMKREHASQVIQAIQAQCDELTWLAVDELVQMHFVGVTKWTAEWEPYEDMAGGDWYILSVETEDGNVLVVGGDDDDYERQTTAINDVLGDVWEEVLSGTETRTRTLDA